MVAQLRPIIHFTKGAHKFEVYPHHSDKQISYLGIFDGQVSVTSDDRHTVTQMLLRRHGPKRVLISRHGLLGRPPPNRV